MFRDLEIWLNHFEYHAQHPRCVPPQLSDVLKDEERRLIARSIAIFQLCEQPEGTSLLRSARRFAQVHNAAQLTRITELFVTEQQRHATLLRAFMEDHDIPRKQTSLTDFVFCCLRHIGRFETRLHVLITAELIANVYYRALESVTGCQRLKVLCRTLVADELAHIGLESQLLLTLRAHRPALVRASARLLHKAFFTCAASAVYLTHRTVLRSAGYNISSYLRVCARQFAFYLEPPVTGAAAAGTSPAGTNRADPRHSSQPKIKSAARTTAPFSQ